MWNVLIIGRTFTVDGLWDTRPRRAAVAVIFYRPRIRNLRYICVVDKPSYPFKVLENGQRFEFESISSDKNIQKVVEFRELEIPNIYNLALVDVKQDGTFDDMSMSNNQQIPCTSGTNLRNSWYH